ncbi:MAG: HlyD family efflux transporter periplasmic adaptor subunit [Pseudomonadota bacterium]
MAVAHLHPTQEPAKEKPADAVGSSGGGPAPSFAEILLAFEAKVREIETPTELFLHISNEARSVFGFRQAFVLVRRKGVEDYILTAASSAAKVDRNAPFVRRIESIFKEMTADVGCADQHCFSLPAYCGGDDRDLDAYPFREFLYTPFLRNGDTLGGVFFAREAPWRENDRLLAQRLADLYAHAWQAQRAPKTKARLSVSGKRVRLGAGLLLVAAALFPTRMTALAPMEISAVDPFMVTAPYDGVVSRIVVEQGQTVAGGDRLVVFEDIERRNNFALAERTERVASARYQRVARGAINDAEAKRELAVAKAELELAQVEKSYALELLQAMEIAADRDGVAIFSDKNDWVGRPVRAGESIMQIADPSLIEVVIDMPVKESLLLQEGASVTIFTDSDPLNALKAEILHFTYDPQPDKRGILSYSVTAKLLEGDASLRIGVQGTARIEGQKAPFALAVLRRPITSLRQLTGL